jgi:hypothetical protein
LACGLWPVLIAVACALAGAGCDSDTSPSQIDVGGAWTGTWRFVTGGLTVTDTVTATLTQNGANATGTWMAASGTSGELSFDVRAAIAGTLTMTQTTLTGQPCTATTTLSGTATPAALEFTTTAPAPSGICQWATSNAFSFRR